MVGGDENKVDGAIALILSREAESLPTPHSYNSGFCKIAYEVAALEV